MRERWHRVRVWFCRALGWHAVPKKLEKIRGGWNPLHRCPYCGHEGPVDSHGYLL